MTPTEDSRSAGRGADSGAAGVEVAAAPAPAPAPTTGWGTQPEPPSGISWRRVLFIGVVCFAVWLLLDAQSLYRSALVQPLGTRRTVAVTILRPISAVSTGLGLSHLVAAADAALGHSVGGGPPLATVAPGARLRVPPPPPVRRLRPGRGPTTTTTTFPVLTARPTAADPLRVLVVGDSIGIDLGQPLVDDLTTTGVVKAGLDGRIDTGLSRPDYFDWPAELGIDLANDHPQLVVVMMGANDPQSLVVAGAAVPYGTPAWDADYGQRVGAFIDEATATGAHVLWVGMPPMQDPGLDAAMVHLNGIVVHQVGLRKGRAAYLSSTTVLGGPGGVFATDVASGGSEVNVRTPDGTHLTPGGGEVLSQAVLTAIRGRLHVEL